MLTFVITENPLPTKADFRVVFTALKIQVLQNQHSESQPTRCTPNGAGWRQSQNYLTIDLSQQRYLDDHYKTIRRIKSWGPKRWPEVEGGNRQRILALISTEQPWLGIPVFIYSKLSLCGVLGIHNVRYIGTDKQADSNHKTSITKMYVYLEERREETNDVASYRGKGKVVSVWRREDVSLN
jgi:hypothetical protein